MNNDKLMERIRRLLGEIRSGEDQRRSSEPDCNRPEREVGKTEDSGMVSSRENI